MIERLAGHRALPGSGRRARYEAGGRSDWSSDLTPASDHASRSQSHAQWELRLSGIERNVASVRFLSTWTGHHRAFPEVTT